jgi:hypothetical protein
MNIISMKQLRENFEPIRKKIEKGQPFLLLYRSKPLATITPYVAGSSFTVTPPAAKKEEPKPVSEKVVEPKKNLSQFGIRGMFNPTS